MRPKEVPSLAVVRWPIERFLSCLDRSGGPEACWPWLRSRKPSGYGHIGVAEGGERWDVIAHRLAYVLMVGPIPDGLDVLHSCDNPPCCNPAHLFVGTRRDNNRDKAAKGRANAPSGSGHHKARLSEAAVADIRRRLDSGKATAAELATEYGTTAATVRRAGRGALWRHVDAPPAVSRGTRGDANGQAKLTVDDVIAMRARHEAGGVRLRDLAAEYGVSEAAVSMAVNGKTWQHVG